jgi:hypothetical protein
VILVDAGPLIAIIHANDENHQRCKNAFRELDQPLATVWPAFTEAMYMLSFSWTAQDALWEFARRGSLEFLPLGGTDLARMHELMRKYKDLPMDLADAALVAVAERERLRTVFTLDRTDFSVYRPARIKHFVIVPEA